MIFFRECFAFSTQSHAHLRVLLQTVGKERVARTGGALASLYVDDALGLGVGAEPVGGAAAVRVTLQIVRGLLEDRLQEVHLLHHHRF